MSLRPRLLACLALLSGIALLPPAHAADLSRAVEIVEAKCFICHGSEGESSSPVFPRLAGQHANYVERQLADYKSGKRKNDTMQAMASDLTAEEMRLLGMYFESKPTRTHAVADPELAQVGRFVYNRGNPFSGVAACADCHGAAGHGTDRLPRVGGQHAQYVENQLKAFSKRERTNDNAVMHTIASKLSELELKAVASYISGLQ